MAIYHFLLVVCSNNVCILHHFRDISLTVYVTAYDLTKSFIFDTAVKNNYSCTRTIHVQRIRLLLALHVSFVSSILYRF